MNKELTGRQYVGRFIAGAVFVFGARSMLDVGYLQLAYLFIWGSIVKIILSDLIY